MDVWHDAPPAPTGPEPEELREQLAAIEHQRWADWQQYMHSLCTVTADGLAIPAKLAERWERQIGTPYANLTEVEKDSDREQVDRYWPVVAAQVSALQADVARLERERNEARAVVEEAKRATRRLSSALIAVSPLLETPYTDAPEWTPWARFVAPALKRLRSSMGMTGDADA